MSDVVHMPPLRYDGNSKTPEGFYRLFTHPEFNLLENGPESLLVFCQVLVIAGLTHDCCEF